MNKNERIAAWQRTAYVAGYPLAVLGYAHFALSLLVMPRTKVIFQVTSGVIILSWLLLRFAASLFPFGKRLFKWQR